jgi:hypothetical protein
LVDEAGHYFTRGHEEQILNRLSVVAPQWERIGTTLAG